LKKAGDSFDSIFSSDLSRASDTAKIIGETLDINSIELTPLLREMDLGVLAGKKRKNLDLREKKLLENTWKDYSNRLPNGESINEFISRLKRFFNLIEFLDPQPISLLVVTHGGSIYHILKSILNIYPAKSEWFGNCKINEIIRSSGNWKIITFNGEIVES
jgi:broad specificity phosphatase PhoE